MATAKPMDESAATLLVAARLEAGMTQRELADRAGTSGAAVAAYERGTKEPRLSTLDRLFHAAGMTLRLSYGPRDRGERRRNAARESTEALTREERRSLALHRAIAARLAADPKRVLAKTRQNLAVMRRANSDGSAEPYFMDWEELLRGPRRKLIEVLVSPDQYARDLRQVSPFAGVLSDAERRAAYQDAY
jgi:transcriptional regulator with XRE-family HTH domain